MNDVNVVKIGPRLSVWRQVLAALRLRRQRRITIRELAALSERQLADIGIARAEIPLVADGLVNRRRMFVAPQGRLLKPAEAVIPSKAA